MRIGIFVEPSTNGAMIADVLAEAAAAERAGLDLCVIPEQTSDATWSATAVAASLGAATNAIRVMALLGIGEHPVRLAEELIVTDLCLAGRFVAILSADAIDPDRRESVLSESLTILHASLAGIPFRHEGQLWQIPARDAGPSPVTVTPTAAQLELPLFVLGLDHSNVALAGGAAPVARATDAPGDASRVWVGDEAPGRQRGRRRIAIRSMPESACDDSSAFDSLVDQLRLEQRTWGLDTCLLRWTEMPSLDRRIRAIRAISAHLRPRVQLDALPEGVEEMWAADAADNPSSSSEQSAP